MKRVVTGICALLVLAATGVAQGDPHGAERSAPPGRAAISAEGKAALARCRELESLASGLRGAERSRALAEAASNYDRVAAGFEGERAVAAAAAFAAAGLWRRHGSLPLAEKDYLLAAAADPGRFGQRGLLGAADMQRRLKRADEALATYREVIAAGPGVTHAQTARLAIARLLRGMDRLDEAIEASRVALECAKPGRQVIEASNLTALLLVQKGDLDGADNALRHAAKSIEGVGNGDPIVEQRLRKAVDSMSARRALRRARDKANGAAADAIRFEVDCRRGIARVL